MKKYGKKPVAENYYPVRNDKDISVTVVNERDQVGE